MFANKHTNARTNDLKIHWQHYKFSKRGTTTRENAKDEKKNTARLKKKQE